MSMCTYMIAKHTHIFVYLIILLAPAVFHESVCLFPSEFIKLIE